MGPAPHLHTCTRTGISHNGERAHSLLCGGEALAKPSGAAVHLLTLFYPAFVREQKKISTRRNLSGCRAEPDQEDLACRRYSKYTSCLTVLCRRRSWRWSQNISCPALGFSDLLQFLRAQKALKAQIFV